MIPILLFFLAVFAAQAQHQRLVVTQDGSGKYASLQAVVDAIQTFPLERVEIFIRDGVYLEKTGGLPGKQVSPSRTMQAEVAGIRAA